MAKSVKSWWRHGVFYQIYPRSFQDSSGDGVGDIAGIIERLPYLLALGIDAIWLSPIFPSPMADFGYDISDYTGIDPPFGTMEHFDALISAAHASGLRAILDLSLIIPDGSYYCSAADSEAVRSLLIDEGFEDMRQDR